MRTEASGWLGLCHVPILAPFSLLHGGCLNVSFLCCFADSLLAQVGECYPVMFGVMIFHFQALSSCNYSSSRN